MSQRPAFMNRIIRLGSSMAAMLRLCSLVFKNKMHLFLFACLLGIPLSANAATSYTTSPTLRTWTSSGNLIYKLQVDNYPGTGTTVTDGFIYFRVASVSGNAFSSSGTVEIKEGSVNGSIVHTFSYDPGVSDTGWSAAYTLPFSTGTKTYYATRNGSPTTQIASGGISVTAKVENALELNTAVLDGKKLGGYIWIPGNSAAPPGPVQFWKTFYLRQGTTNIAQAAVDGSFQNIDTPRLIWRKMDGTPVLRWDQLLSGTGPFTLKVVGQADDNSELESSTFTFTLQNTLSAQITANAPDKFPRYKQTVTPAATVFSAVVSGAGSGLTRAWYFNNGTSLGTASTASRTINDTGLNVVTCIVEDSTGKRTTECYQCPIAYRDLNGDTSATDSGSASFLNTDVVTGNLHLSGMDMSMPAIGVPFSLSRFYNSTPSAISSPKGWTFNLETKIYREHMFTIADFGMLWPTTLVYYPDGTVCTFYLGLDGKYYSAQPGNHDLLVENYGAGTLTLFTEGASPTAYTYQVSDPLRRANVGYRLVSIRNLRNQGITLNYVSAGSSKISTVTDQSGRTYTFSYADADAPTKISQVSDVSGRSVAFNWNADGNMLTSGDVRGYTTTYSYHTSGNGNKRLKSIQLPRGNLPVSDISYDISRRVSSITAPAASVGGGGTSYSTTFSYLSTYTDVLRPGTGNNIRYQLDSNRNVISITDSQGVANRTTVLARIGTDDIAGQNARVSDLGLTTQSQQPGISTTALTYSTDGRGLVEGTSFAGNSTSVSYDISTLASNNRAAPSTVVDQRNKTFTPQFTSTGELAAFLNPYNQGGKVTEFDAATGKPRYVNDGRDNITEFQYTATGDIWKVIVPDPYNSSQRTTTFSYPSGNANRGLPSTIIDRKGYQTYIEWDNAGKPTLIRAVDLATNPFNGETRDITITYDANGNQSSVTDRRGQTTNYDYDDLDRPWRVRQPSPDGSAARPATTTEFDSLGRPTKTTNANGNTSERVYGTSGTAAGMLQSVRTYKAGGTYDIVQSYSYLADGRIDTETDGEGIVRTRVYHSSPRQHLVYRITEPAPNGYLNYQEFDYDQADNLVRETVGTTDPNVTRPLPSTLYTYDDAGRRSAVINVMNGNWSNPNDPAHVKTQVTYYGDDSIDVITDPRGQPIKHLYTTTGLLETRRDALNNEWTYRYDANGNPVQEIFPGNASYLSRTITRGFGVLDRLTSINYGDGLNTNVTFTYDTNGNRLSMTDRQGGTSYGYDLLNRITAMTHTPSGRSSLGLAYAYLPGGQVKSITYPGSRTVNYGYDHLERMLTVTPWTGGAFGYTWRRNGQLDLATSPNGTQTDYQYSHPAGRLSGMVTTRGATVIANEQFTTDPAENITRITGEMPITPPNDASRTMTVDNANRLATVGGLSITNDPAGRSRTLPTPLTATTTWEGMDWLSSYTKGAQTSFYGYNGDGVRIHATKGGTTTRYLIDPAAGMPNVMAECDDANAPQRFYIQGLGLLASIDTSNNVLTYHPNRRGDILALTNASGTVTDTYGYSPYGLTAVSNPLSTNPFRFGGQFGVMDEGNGLHFMRARYYTASSGRFLSMDQLPGFLGNPQSLDRFAYALGNPVMNVDPSGLYTSYADSQQLISSRMASLEQELSNSMAKVKNLDSLIAKENDSGRKSRLSKLRRKTLIQQRQQSAKIAAQKKADADARDYAMRNDQVVEFDMMNLYFGPKAFVYNVVKAVVKSGGEYFNDNNSTAAGKTMVQTVVCDIAPEGFGNVGGKYVGKAISTVVSPVCNGIFNDPSSFSNSGPLGSITSGWVSPTNKSPSRQGLSGF